MRPQEETRPLMAALASRRAAIVDAWLARTLQTYPEPTSRFLVREQDPFRNPVGQAFKEAFPVLLDEVLGGMDAGRLTPALERLVRIRAVQDFTAARAVAFVFALKGVIRDALRNESQASPNVEVLAAVDGRIDEVALLAFDLFMRCRESVYEIKANDARRRASLLERMYGRERYAEACGPDGPPGP